MSPPDPNRDSESSRRPGQFGLRTLLIATTAAGLYFAVARGMTANSLEGPLRWLPAIVLLVIVPGVFLLQWLLLAVVRFLSGPQEEHMRAHEPDRSPVRHRPSGFDGF